MTSTKPLHVFCYGSLRPDDDTGMPWTKSAVQGMRAQRASVFGAKLYNDEYAALVLDDSKPNSSVQGWVLTAGPVLFQKKMETFDYIEGYEPDGNGFYQRTIKDVCLGDPDDCIGKQIGTSGDLVKCYVYHKPNCSKEVLIPSGDWLRRDEVIS